MATTPTAPKTDVALGHAYDGIREYDNPLPGWWKWLFIITVVISPMYLLYFHVGADGRSLEDQYLAAMNANTRKKYKDLGDLTPDSKTIYQYSQDPDWTVVGQSIFKVNCVSCHEADGGGKVGPNLCDDNYKYVKGVADVYKVIKEGAAGGAMPAWGTRIGNANDLIMLSAYVASLRGSKPAKPKGPEGSPIPPWSPN